MLNRRARLRLLHFVAALRPCALMAAWMAVSVAAPSAIAQSADREPTFDVMEYVIEGNTVLDTESIERAVLGFLGPARRFDDVEAARRTLEIAYRRAGYGFASVDIPEQRVDGGVVRLVVTEGRIARTRVTGARYFSQGYILERVAAAAEGQVPHLPTIQAQLTEVNRSADRRVTPVLRPGRAAGTTEVDLAVEDRLPVNGSVTLNNQSSRNTSASRLQLALSYDNLWQRDHALGVQAVVSPERTSEVQVLTASYSVPLGPGGLESLSLSATRSNSDVFAGVADTRLFGDGTVLSLRRSWVLALADGQFQQLVAGVDHKDVTDVVQAGAGAGFDTPIRYLPLSLAWTGVFRAPGGDWQFGATLSGGLRGLVNEQQQFADKRFAAQASYALLRVEARHQRTLGIAGLRLRAQADAQLSPAPLISNEQFVVGGANSVRGYLEAEAVGDQGLRGSLQVGSPNLVTKMGWRRLTELGVHVFVDAAATELRRPLPGQTSRFRLLGAGLGLGLATAPPWPLTLGLDFGWPLHQRGLVGSEGLRVHASASVGF